jgi:multiple sugar transport system permease protein
LFTSLLSGRRGRNIREYLTAYLMIAPAVILIFTFGIFPVGFALYVSLFRWRLKQGDFIGLTNYQQAIGNLIFVLLFALAVGGVIGTIKILQQIKARSEERKTRPWVLALPSIIYATMVLSFIRWTILLLPNVLGIADKIVGQEKTRQLFVQLLWEAFTNETVLSGWWLFVGLLLGSILVGILTIALSQTPDKFIFQIYFLIAWLAIFLSGFILWFTYNQVINAYQAAAQTGTSPAIWSQIVTVLSGVILLWFAWKFWPSFPQNDGGKVFLLRIFFGLVFLVGGWLLLGEIPVFVAASDPDVWSGLKVTIFYSIGTIPFQLGISIFLAVLLFQQLRGSELFRMLFFLPYVTPAVASAAVFRQLFSNRVQSPINQILRLIGIQPQQWLFEPKGIFTLLGDSIGVSIPTWAAGPSLALVVIIIYSIWTFVGYDTVIYLAGLGNIPDELQEAAEIDGAGRWQVFRFITFPLLSPTTYFLSLIAVIGTFKAFNHIWVMRQDLALGTTDTFSVTIFIEFYDKLRYGYASALAFVLFAVILSLTYLNNRIQGTRVFYG